MLEITALIFSLHRYDHLIPLHYMYLAYLSEMLPLPAYPNPPLLDSKLRMPQVGKLENGLSTEQLSSRLVKADFTGAVIRGTFFSRSPVRASVLMGCGS
jgi:hypothetical protein